MFRLMRDMYDPYDYRSLLTSSPFEDVGYSPRVLLNVVRPRRQTSLCSRHDTQGGQNKFQAMFNVKHFRPDEIDVKTVDDYVVISAKHEEHADEHGFVSREFVRRYKLPEDVEPSTVTSSLSQDGVLTIQAPRKQLEPPPKNERIVPITIQQPAAVEEAQKQQQQMQEQQNAEEQQQKQ